MEQQHAPSGRTDRSDAPGHEVPHGGYRLRGVTGSVQGHSWLVRIERNLYGLSFTYREASRIPEIADHLRHRGIEIDSLRRGLELCAHKHGQRASDRQGDHHLRHGHSLVLTITGALSVFM